MRAAVTRYRVMANVVGVFLLLLCASMVIKYGPPKDAIYVTIVGQIHGVLYIVYLVTAFDLYRRKRWPLGRMVAMVCAGFLPFLAFVVERRIVRDVRAGVEDAGKAGHVGEGAEA